MKAGMKHSRGVIPDTRVVDDTHYLSSHYLLD